ncbi:NUDIX domain-containing protein [Micromonospora sp. WMMD987]|jgi:8-oxo-dGTP diphosphatase|uniref:NUDIX hydrolase n=1 Tax=Micromonospora sp. WMMD987 TaxID=3016089 RepID=UPI00249C2D93|nr:NUDIX domain-containing protein [Micromonospora sp. WMMD987]WFE95671.1 NUDIX domain-containing protein [Micromonospora sp. WMMD987]
MSEYPPFAVTVDLVVLTVRAEELHLLLVRRGIPPDLGRWALPGGFVGIDEDLPDAAVRELTEETGLPEPAGHLEQLGTYGRPDRDPRGRVVTVAWLALLPDLPTPVAGSDAASAEWVPVTRLTPGQLAFDHDRIVADGLERARAKLEYTPLASAFCPAEFTVAQLRAVYETVWGTRLDPRNFHRKVTGTPGFVSPVGRATEGDRGRPAQLFRRGPAIRLHPPMLRPEP